MDRHHGNTIPDQYTLRVAINYEGDPKLDYGGFQTTYQTNSAWTQHVVTFKPTDAAEFYISFKGIKGTRQMGAMITMVTVIEHIN